MIVNNASNGATANFTYNYVKYTDAEGTVTEQPTAAMVKGPVLYSPYYVCLLYTSCSYRASGFGGNAAGRGPGY